MWADSPHPSSQLPEVAIVPEASPLTWRGASGTLIHKIALPGGHREESSAAGWPTQIGQDLRQEAAQRLVIGLRYRIKALGEMDQRDLLESVSDPARCTPRMTTVSYK